MDRVITTLALDFNDNDSMLVVPIQQGDHNGRMIKLKLYDDGDRIPLYSSDRATLNAACKGIITAAGMSCQIIDDIVYLPITEDLTSIPGIEHCVVRIDGAQGRVHTARFDLNVGADPAAAGTPGILATADLVDRVSDLEVAVRELQEGGGSGTISRSGTVVGIISGGYTPSVYGIAQEGD